VKLAASAVKVCGGLLSVRVAMRAILANPAKGGAWPIADANPNTLDQIVKGDDEADSSRAGHVWASASSGT